MKQRLVITVLLVLSQVAFLRSQISGLKSQTSSTDSILRNWIKPQTVNSTHPVASTFYLWMSSNELDSVIAQKQILRTISWNDRMASLYLQKLVQKGVMEKEPLADHLLNGNRQRIRTCWPNYWSVLTETDSTSKDDQLVQVVLMDSALIVKFSPDENKKRRWQIFDIRGNEISMQQAMLRKHHIAVVFFEGKNKTTYVAPRPLHVKEYYRTFLLCNEDMIKSWHHGVPGMQAKIIQDLDYLLLLHGYFNEGWTLQSQGKKGKVMRASWTMERSAMKMNNCFFATQRFAWMTGVNADSYQTKHILELLRNRWPKQKNPCERFPGRK